LDRWNVDRQWVSDEDGFRWYFSERDPGGPSRLECYRLLLAKPGELKGRPAYVPRFCLDAYSAAAAAIARWADLFELAKRAWRGQAVLKHEIAGR
jgi:hypothetical protein